MEQMKLMASAVNKCVKPKTDIPIPANRGPNKCDIWPEIEIAELAAGSSSGETICGIILSRAGLKNVENVANKNVRLPINKGVIKLNTIANGTIVAFCYDELSKVIDHGIL